MSKMGCFPFAKVVMVLFNLLILVSGLTLLVMAIWASVDGASHLQILGPFSSQSMRHVNVAHFYMAIGALLVLLAFLGCCGAHKGSKCLLLTFFSIILIIVIAEVAAAVVTLAYSSFAKRILCAYASHAVLTEPCNATTTEGCFEQILQSLTEHANIVGAIAAGVAILEIAALMVSMYFYCHMDKRVS
ncbi:tetraspanin-1 [Syngnathus typhle]|uniref:tetraspanin-1 n=1 Tax=Syngnathus typhle TaxID=161592 RepID=UPI002A6A9A0C|nr:tetraspanin-1 [Syngnathus typhle]